MRYTISVLSAIFSGIAVSVLLYNGKKTTSEAMSVFLTKALFFGSS